MCAHFLCALGTTQFGLIVPAATEVARVEINDPKFTTVALLHTPEQAVCFAKALANNTHLTTVA